MTEKSHFWKPADLHKKMVSNCFEYIFSDLMFSAEVIILYQTQETVFNLVKVKWGIFEGVRCFWKSDETLHSLMLHTKKINH